MQTDLTLAAAISARMASASSTVFTTGILRTGFTRFVMAVLLILRLYLPHDIGVDEVKAKFRRQIHGGYGKIADGQRVAKIYSGGIEPACHDQLVMQFLDPVRGKNILQAGARPLETEGEKVPGLFDGRQLHHIAALAPPRARRSGCWRACLEAQSVR